MNVDGFFDTLEARLASRPSRSLVDFPGFATMRESAVLVPVFEREGVPHVLFTRRPSHLRHHADQFSFPGGGRDAVDVTPLHTALRETEEELGIERPRVRVLGMLDEVPTMVTGYRIQPFVGVVPGDGVYHPNPDEVAFILEVPLAGLLDPSIRRTEKRQALGQEFEVDFYTYNQHVIWGATARILNDFLRRVAEVPGLASPAR
ncbi:CoA pyrophosphatase [Myxococcaceae bacterium GXIMD 01537]